MCVHCAARRPHVLLTGNERVVVQDGRRLQLRCRASGRPQPKVTWLKDGQTLRNTTTVVDYGLHVTHTRSALSLCPVIFCKLQYINIQGRVQQFTGRIDRAIGTAYVRQVSCWTTFIAIQ